jgi:hypothetical protein
MRKTLTFCCFLLLAGIASAQNPAIDFKYALKLSNLSSLTISRIRDTQGNNIGGSYLRLFQPIPSFSYKTKKGNFNEIGLNQISMNARLGNSPLVPLSNFVLSVSLTKHLVFFKSKETAWVPMLGIGLIPSYNFHQLDPNNNPLLLKSRQQFGVELLVTPRITWYSKGRFFLDFGLPISLANANVTQMGFQPINSTTGRTQTNLNLSLFNPQIMGQIGFGIKL